MIPADKLRYLKTTNVCYPSEYVRAVRKLIAAYEELAAKQPHSEADAKIAELERGEQNKYYLKECANPIIKRMDGDILDVNELLRDANAGAKALKEKEK